MLQSVISSQPYYLLLLVDVTQYDYFFVCCERLLHKHCIWQSMSLIINNNYTVVTKAVYSKTESARE